MDVLLNFGRDAKETQLTTQLFAQDSGEMDSTNPDDGSNPGLLMRTSGLFDRNEEALVAREFSTISPLYVDVCQQGRLLLPGVKIQVKLYPSDNTFRLQAAKVDGDYIIEILDAKLQVCTATVNPTILLTQGEILSRSPAIYPYLVSDIRQFNITQSQSSIVINDMFQNKVPSTVVLAMVPSSAFQGRLDLNGFNLKKL